MYKKIIVLLVFLLPILTFGQNIRFEGFVKDSTGNGLEMANVIAFKKGTKFLQSYSITDSNGKYRLSLEVNNEYTLRVSFLGYDSQSFDVKVAEENVERDIVLSEASEALSEVEITYEMPVKISGDTISYNADSFKTGTEKKLEDVLEKLPGVDIDENGEVEVEGKKVQKVLVEGKEFFEGDTKLATQNIPASAVDKVQVLRNYNEVSGMRSVTNNEDNIALNIKLKEGKKNFWFGDIKAGAGDDSKYIVTPKLFYYSPEKSLNIMGDINNIGESPFTMSDFFRFGGGMRSAMSGSGTSMSFSSGGGRGFMGMQNNQAQEIKSKFGAINFSFAPKSSLDISGFATASDSETEMLNQSSVVYNKTGLNETNETATLQGSQSAMLKFGATYRPSEDIHISYDIIGKISEQNEFNDVTSSNRGAVDTYKDEKPVSLNQNFNYYNTRKDKTVFAAELQYLYEKNQPLYNSMAGTQPFLIIPTSDAERLYNIYQNKRTSTHKLDAKLDYYYLLTKKSNINLTIGATLSRQDFDSSIEQELDNGNILRFPNTELNNEAKYNFNDWLLGVHYKMVSGIFTFNPGFTLHYYSLKDIQQGSENKQEVTKFLPDVYASLQFKSSESLRFNYAITTQFSDINQVAEGYVLGSYNSLSRGDRNIEESLRHRYSLNYFSFSMFSFTNIHASINYMKSLNSVNSSSELIGVDRISFPVNSEFANESLSGSFRYGKTYKHLKTNFRTNISHSIFNNIVNDEEIKSKSLTHSYQGSVSTKFRKAPNFEFGYQKTFTDYSNTGSTTDRPFGNIEVVFLKDFILTADYSYYNYKNDENTVKNTYSFLNAELFYQKMDSPWEFILSAKNLTDNTSINRDSYNETFDSNSTSLYFVQPRLFLFTIKYNL